MCFIWIWRRAPFWDYESLDSKYLKWPMILWMDIVGLDYSSRTATSYIINPAVGAPTRPESICQSINKMMKS